MLQGSILILLGVALVVVNKEIGIITGTVKPGYFSDFWSSTARQNIAIIGVLFSVAGLFAILLL